MLKCGIVGLPNVGKSTLFNALTQSNVTAEVANYPFCTIEPNSAIVAVPDDRLIKLAKIASSKKIINATIEFVDIAGLVKGASSGEGLGNKFLSHIREVDAIIHVLRCFEDVNVTHVYNRIAPIDDADIVHTELMISDLSTVQKLLTNAEKQSKSGDKTAKEQINLLRDCENVLSKGKPVRILKDKYDTKTLKSLQLLTSKPVLYVANVLETDAHKGNEYTKQLLDNIQQDGAQDFDGCITISSKIEAEIATLQSLEEKREYLSSLGLAHSGLDRIISASYSLLDLKSFFTIGPKEAHVWSFKSGTLAPQAAGIIHSDFERGFICAEVISYDDYIKYDGESAAKSSGKVRLEGKQYVMQDGDIVHFKFNV